MNLSKPTKNLIEILGIVGTMAIFFVLVVIQFQWRIPVMAGVLTILNGFFLYLNFPWLSKSNGHDPIRILKAYGDKEFGLLLLTVVMYLLSGLEILIWLLS